MEELATIKIALDMACQKATDFQLQLCLRSAITNVNEAIERVKELEDTK